jgi:hypothetical protein
VTPRGATPPGKALKGEGGRPILYWHPVTAAGVITLALVIALAAVLKPAVPQAGPKEDGPARPEAEPSGLASQLHGTNVAFARPPAEAARLAGSAGKLTFLLHLSGDFEDPDFT